MFFNLFLDMDGVFYDFEGYFLTRFGYKHNSVSDAEMWTTIRSDPEFFLNLPLFDGAHDFWKSLISYRYGHYIRPFFLTSCPKDFYYEASRQKISVIRRDFGDDVPVLPVRGGTQKKFFMQTPMDVLIDDWEKNTSDWMKHGGVAITHRNFDRTLGSLEFIIRKRKENEARN